MTGLRRRRGHADFLLRPSFRYLPRRLKFDCFGARAIASLSFDPINLTKIVNLVSSYFIVKGDLFLLKKHLICRIFYFRSFASIFCVF